MGMIRIKQNIAVIFSSVAILALLLHGIIPHHHHDSESENCRIEEQSASCQSCTHHSGPAEHGNNHHIDHQHSDSQQHAHVCNLNGEKIKNVSNSLVAVISCVTFQEKVTEQRPQIPQYSEPFSASPPPELHQLRGPPLG